MMFEAFWKEFQQEASDRFEALSRSHNSFLIESPSKYLNFRCALRFCSSEKGKETNPSSPPANCMLIRQELVNAISIEDIRDMKRFIALKPLKEGRRFVVIESADNLSLEAQNALLKTLEEPPPDLRLLLCTRNRDKLLPTVLSRAVSIQPVIPQKTQCLDFLSSYISPRAAHLLYVLFSSEPAEMFSLPEDAVELLEGYASSAFDTSSPPELPDTKDFLAFLEDLAAGQVGTRHVSIHNSLFLAVASILSGIRENRTLQALSTAGAVHALISSCTGSFLKNSPLNKDDTSRLLRERIYPFLLLSVDSLLKSPSGEFPATLLKGSETGGSGKVLALERINDWFVSKNLKFLSFFEGLIFILASDSPAIERNT